MSSHQKTRPVHKNTKNGVESSGEFDIVPDEELNGEIDHQNDNNLVLSSPKGSSPYRAPPPNSNIVQITSKNVKRNL